jgi:hypothetical protein
MRRSREQRDHHPSDFDFEDESSHDEGKEEEDEPEIIRPSQRQRVDPIPQKPHAQPCNGNCLVAHMDINFHKEDHQIVPCPLYFQTYPIYDLNFEPVDSNAIVNKICDAWDDQHKLLFTTLLEGVGDIHANANTPERRKQICHLFQTIGAFEVFRNMPINAEEIGLKTVEMNTMLSFLTSLRFIAKPMSAESLQLPPGLRCVITNTCYSILYQSSNNFINNISTILCLSETVLMNSVKQGLITEDQVRNCKDIINQCRCAIQVTERAISQIQDPPDLNIDLENGELNRDLMIDYIINYLASKGVVITDTETPTKALVALKRYEPNGVFNYTYTQPMTVGEALVNLKVDKPVSRIYAKQIENISKELHTFHEQSCIPRSPDDFVSKMRYIAFPNGLFCCITGIFYYHRAAFDNRMPANWSHFSENLEKLNGCKIRAMNYMKHPMRYYDLLSLLIGGEFIRTKFPQQKRKRDLCEEEMIDQYHGNDTVFNSDVFDDPTIELSDEQKEEQKKYIQTRLATFNTWMFDKDYLKLLDTLDIRCRAPQKVFGDQHIPRNAYRRWLSAHGRCLSGVIGRETREKNGAQKYMESIVQKPIDDALEYAACFIGVAGCGKSSILNMLQRYFTPTLIGQISDTLRNIDHFSTIRDKAVCLASDYHSDAKNPSIPTGDLKKAISTEAVVHNRLFQVSKIIYFLSMFVFASNNPLPFHESNGDISRRLFQFFMRRKVAPDQRKFAQGDDRNVMQVFDAEDTDSYAFASVWEHKRILLNVGNSCVYEPCDPTFIIPKFLKDTQLDFIRANCSLTAFLLSLGKRFGWGHANLGCSVEREKFMDMYREYCEKYKVECKKDSAVDAELIRNYLVAVNPGPPPVYTNIRISDPIEEQLIAQPEDEEEDVILQ